MVTVGLIAINVGVFVALSAIAQRDPARAEHLKRLGAVWGSDFHAYALVTSAFLHAGWMHILFNMLFLWVFGPNVEDKLGRLGFLAFYLLGGAVSGGLHAAFSAHPAIGASGAIAAVTGAYLVLFLNTHIRCFFFFFLIGIVDIPALWFIAFSVAWDFFSPALFGNTGVAHIAHIAGYTFGFCTALALVKIGVLQREPFDLLTMLRQSRRRAEMREAYRMSQRDQERRMSTSDPEQERLALDRAGVLEAIGDGDLDRAAGAYRDLLSRHGAEAALLSRDSQYAIANHLFQMGDHNTASTAYERFIAGYPGDREIAHVKLLLGLLNARYLNDPIRAERLVREALDSGILPDQQAIARDLLRELGVEA